MREIIKEFAGRELAFYTDDGLFSPSAPDRGTAAMLSLADIRQGARVLDLGCGWGYAGICAAAAAGPENVWMTDIDPHAVEVSMRSAEANGLHGIHFSVGDAYDGVDASGFDLILSNPPYHADFSVPSRFITKGFNRLRIGGRLMMVTKRREWYFRRISAVFGGVHVDEADGYFIFTAERRDYKRADK